MDRVVLNSRSLDDSISMLDSMASLNEFVDSLNQKAQTRNPLVQKHNDSIVVYNRLALLPAPLKYKDHFDSLSYYYTRRFSSEIEQNIQQVSIDSSRVSQFIYLGNQECDPRGVFPLQFTDSLFRILDSLALFLDATYGAVRRVEEILEDRNENQIIPLNEQIAAWNAEVDRYNDSIKYVSSTRIYNAVKTSSELLTALTEAQAGDTVVVDTGTFKLSLRVKNSGTDSMPIVIIGAPFGRTVMDSTDAIISDRSNIRFYNLVFNRSTVTGFKVENKCRNLYFENCVFSNNNLHGLDIIESGVELRNCQSFGNGLCGLRVQGSMETDYVFKAENVLLTRNSFYGMYTITATVFVTNATISHNGLDGVKFEVPNRSVTLMRSNITYNGQYGVRWSSTHPQVGFFITPYSNFFGNASGIILADSSIIKMNEPYMSIEPKYVNPGMNNYRVGSEELKALDVGYKY